MNPNDFGRSYSYDRYVHTWPGQAHTHYKGRAGKARAGRAKAKRS